MFYSSKFSDFLMASYSWTSCLCILSALSNYVMQYSLTIFITSLLIFSVNHYLKSNVGSSGSSFLRMVYFVKASFHPIVSRSHIHPCIYYISTNLSPAFIWIAHDALHKSFLEGCITSFYNSLWVWGCLGFIECTYPKIHHHCHQAAVLLEYLL